MYDEKGAREAKKPQSPLYRGDDDDNDNKTLKNRGFFAPLIALSIALTPNQVSSKNNKPHSQLFT